jgi:oligopeptide transport system permease protein
MASIKDKLSRGLEESMSRRMEREADALAAMSDEELFSFAEYDEKESEKTGYSNYSYWGSTIRMFLKNRGAVCMLVIMLAILIFTIIQPYLPGQMDPNLVNADPERFIPLRNVPPGADFWFGTNSIGQDLWARIWTGTRTSLFIGFSVALVEAVVGITVGVLWGYMRRLDFLFTEIYNVLDNIPHTIILILIAYIMTPSVKTLIFAMSLTGWIGMARFIRNQILIIRDRDYNLASRCLGTPTYRLVMRNLLPYLVSVIMLRMALSIPAAIGSEVFITYIGLGLPATTPGLGRLIEEGRVVMMNAAQRYQLIYPTLILSIVTVSFYIIGNAFSDAADPKNHR